MKINPDAAGLDERRLARIDRHLESRYMEPGKLAGCQVLVARRGHVAHLSSLGSMDRERDKPVADDTIWRLYSMTKPITGVALMTLYEHGMFQLNDPVHRFIPEWRDMKVRDGADLVEPRRPVSVRDVMMHMSGIGYGPGNADIDPSILGTDSWLNRFQSLEAMTLEIAEAPLRFHPGTQWLYSLGTDVCARLVEILSGQRFDQYLQTALFGPLGMVDTGFTVPDQKADRFAASYRRNSRKELKLLDDPERSAYRRDRRFLSGGGGLVSTAADYLRFCQMLLNGGELDGVRILGRKTVELMTSNHLPADGELRSYALPGGYGEVGMDGMGFGLTVAVSQGPVETSVIGSRGEFMWGGAASTIFWVDPAEELIVIFMTQLIPSGTFNFRGQLKTIIYPAITD